MKIATKLTKRVAEFVNENKIGLKGNTYYETICESLFHYPQVKTDGHAFLTLEEGYTSVSEQEFIDMVTAELTGTEKQKEMKTKCIVLGQENEPKKELKNIEFVRYLNHDSNINGTQALPSDFKNVELVSKYHSMFDLMFAYDSDRSLGCLFLGHWNDGVA